MLLPGLAVLALFFGLPVLDLVRTSLSDWSGIGPREWVGVDNFVEVFTEATIRSGLIKSVIMGVGVALGIAALGTVLAAFVSRGLAGSRDLPRAVVPPRRGTAQRGGGVLGAVRAAVRRSRECRVGRLGSRRRPAWLADPSTALVVIIAVGIWRGVGFAFLIILGAMEEAAVWVDSGDRRSRGGEVLLPDHAALDPPSAARQSSCSTSCWAFNGFTLVWGMTRGGPGDATTVLPVLVYKDAFQFSNFGVAAAMSVVGGAILLIIGFAGYAIGSRKAPDA